MSAPLLSKKKTLALVIGSALSSTAFADTQIRVTPSQMVQGGNGLIQTPTARMRDEGGMAINYTDNGEYRFWSVNIQLYDWMIGWKQQPVILTCAQDFTVKLNHLVVIKR